MPRYDIANRLERLEKLTSRLKADEPLVMKTLADELGISLRTLARDLDILRDRGLPIETDKGRGGGVRLHRLWAIGRLQLNYTEATNLLVSLAIAEKLKSPWLISSLDSIRRKLSASFSPLLRDRIKNLRTRILVGDIASSAVLENFEPLLCHASEGLFESFLEQQRIRISYKDGSGIQTKREIEPQLLLLNYPVWYVVGWDSIRSAVRTFRLDRIQSVEIASGHFPLRKLSLFEEALKGSNTINP